MCLSHRSKDSGPVPSHSVVRDHGFRPGVASRYAVCRWFGGIWKKINRGQFPRQSRIIHFRASSFFLLSYSLFFDTLFDTCFLLRVTLLYSAPNLPSFQEKKTKVNRLTLYKYTLSICSSPRLSCCWQPSLLARWPA